MIDFTKLDIWKRAHHLTLEIYKLTKMFPKEERFDLVIQMRNSSSSIPMNISEGCGRGTNRQLLNFLRFSMGSGSELEYQLLLSKDLGYLGLEEYNVLNSELIVLKKMIYSFMKSIKQKIDSENL